MISTQTKLGIHLRFQNSQRFKIISSKDYNTIFVIIEKRWMDVARHATRVREVNWLMIAITNPVMRLASHEITKTSVAAFRNVLVVKDAKWSVHKGHAFLDTSCNADWRSLICPEVERKKKRSDTRMPHPVKAARGVLNRRVLRIVVHPFIRFADSFNDAVCNGFRWFGWRRKEIRMSLKYRKSSNAHRSLLLCSYLRSLTNS